MTRVYEYDVFISYKRGVGDLPTWVHNHLHPRLCAMLDDNLHYDAKVYFDHNQFTSPKWPTEHTEALRRSRVLVPVYSAKYFYDEWCLAELESMLDRELLVAKASGQASCELVQPLVYCDTHKLGKRFQDRPLWRFNDWSQPQPQFELSQRYVTFDAELRLFVDKLVRLIAEAPKWRADWPVSTPAPDRPIVAGMPGW